MDITQITKRGALRTSPFTLGIFCLLRNSKNQTPQEPQFPPAQELHPPPAPLIVEPPLCAKNTDSLRFTFSPPHLSQAIGWSDSL
jgi:hypothetical protein